MALRRHIRQYDMIGWVGLLQATLERIEYGDRLARSFAKRWLSQYSDLSSPAIVSGFQSLDSSSQKQ